MYFRILKKTVDDFINLSRINGSPLAPAPKPNANTKISSGSVDVRYSKLLNFKNVILEHCLYQKINENVIKAAYHRRNNFSKNFVSQEIFANINL